MRLAEPWYLLLIIPLLILVYFFVRNRVGKEATLRFSSVKLVQSAGVHHWPVRRILQVILRTVAIFLFIIALARPQTSSGESTETKDIIDIMLAIDTSSSMATLDFHPDNRLEAAKLEAKRFIEKRPHDRFGLTIFSKQSVTQSPLTTDRKALLSLLNRIQMGVLEDGTAIGVGLANAVNRLKDSEAKSRIVVLLTDGINNSGEIDPMTAARIAAKMDVRLYTIGMGVEGEALLPVDDPRFGRRLVRVRTQIDEMTLREMSEMTGGFYFRARDEKALRDIFAQIDEMEKTEIEVHSFTRYEEHYAPFVWFGLLALMFEVFLMNFIFVRIP